MAKKNDDCETIEKNNDDARPTDHLKESTIIISLISQPKHLTRFAPFKEPFHPLIL